MARFSSHPALRQLSPLQRTLLRWLDAELQRRHPMQESAAIPYWQVVQGVAAAPAQVRTGLQQLLRAGLVTLPRQGWARSVALTAAGRACARALAQLEAPHRFLKTLRHAEAGDGSPRWRETKRRWRRRR
ncbi:MAG: hypothetical protein KatS3mg131_3448 [Candidatus Tectimicrobiota bacterium]|nr:MAG: hypothetical protein KatS3mg131_3448 [Candidatus Tectomicrobia bacterium]